MKVTILHATNAWPLRGMGIEIASCPAIEHNHSWRGYLKGRCICPSTLDAYEEHKQQQRAAQARYRAGLPPRPRITGRVAPAREIDDCPAERHRHSHLGYNQDGCRCPSTIKAYERRLETQRLACRRHREKRQSDTRTMQIDLRRADRHDAESLAMGLHTGPTDKHTRALAVLMMIRANPAITDRQLSWRLASAGQTGRGGKPISVRQINRIVATLKVKEEAAGRRLHRLDVDLAEEIE
jgi:hypothetical protein